MHLIDVDIAQTIPGGREDDHTKVHHRVSIQFGRKLGQ